MCGLETKTTKKTTLPTPFSPRQDPGRNRLPGPHEPDLWKSTGPSFNRTYLEDLEGWRFSACRPGDPASFDPPDPSPPRALPHRRAASSTDCSIAVLFSGRCPRNQNCKTAAHPPLTRATSTAILQAVPQIYSQTAFTGHLKAVWWDFVARHEIALESVCGAGLSLKLMCGAGPGDLRPPRGSDSADNGRRPGLLSQTPLKCPAPGSPRK